MNCSQNSMQKVRKHFNNTHIQCRIQCPFLDIMWSELSNKIAYSLKKHWTFWTQVRSEVSQDTSVPGQKCPDTSYPHFWVRTVRGPKCPICIAMAFITGMAYVVGVQSANSPLTAAQPAIWWNTVSARSRQVLLCCFTRTEANSLFTLNRQAGTTKQNYSISGLFECRVSDSSGVLKGL